MLRKVGEYGKIHTCRFSQVYRISGSCDGASSCSVGDGGGGGGKVEAGKVEAGGPGGCEDANAKHSDPDRRMSYVKKKKNW